VRIKDAIARVVQRLDLSRNEMRSVMTQIMTGICSDLEISAFLVAMRMKSESIDEIYGAVTIMRELATPVKVEVDHLIDIVGTGGDAGQLFNVSTASAFVAAAAGAHVAKHGNRGVSSGSGSADLSEKAGINLNLSPEQTARCIQKVGIGFIFAPAYHSAMKNVASIRRSLGIRTLFNILGPLSNPSGVDSLVIGVFSRELCRPMTEVLRELGNKHVMVVHSVDGLDEISIASETRVAELKNNEIKEYAIKPEDFNITSQSLIGMRVTNSTESFDLIRDAFDKRVGKYANKVADMIALNAGAGIYVSGIAKDLKQGIAMAKDIIANGSALKKVLEVAHFSKILSEETSA